MLKYILKFFHKRCSPDDGQLATVRVGLYLFFLCVNINIRIYRLHIFAESATERKLDYCVVHFIDQYVSTHFPPFNRPKLHKYKISIPFAFAKP